MAKLTILTVKNFEKMSVAGIGTGEAKYWNDSVWASSIVPGAVLEIEFEDRENYKDKTKTEKWIKTVDGVLAKPPKTGGFKGGGGGPKECKADPKKTESIERQVALKEMCLDSRAKYMKNETMTEDQETKRFNFLLGLLNGNA
jgi:hypothetical protein